jgi:hypothetical protein
MAPCKLHLSLRAHDVKFLKAIIINCNLWSSLTERIHTSQLYETPEKKIIVLNVCSGKQTGNIERVVMHNLVC